jgi:hypothetical protein
LKTVNTLLRIDNIPQGKIVHAGAAFAISFVALFFLAAAFVAATSSALAGIEALDERADSIKRMEEKLTLRRRELDGFYQLIGATADNAAIVASAENTKERLKSEATAFIDVLEQYGFSVQNRSDPTETSVSSALSLYQSRITLVGDVNAVAKFLSSDLETDGYIASMSITNNDAAIGVGNFTAEINFRRIGARGAPLKDDGDE